MKNLMIWISPYRYFDDETRVLVKIQIDNSLELGWQKKDMLLFTNFDYQYRGVKARTIGDNAFCNYLPISTKITGLLELFKMGEIKPEEIYWVHDFDCYQLWPFKKGEIMLDDVDMALCDYGRRPKWSGGSIFFKKSAQDLFEKQSQIMTEFRCVDEKALNRLTKSNPQAKARIRKLNSSYHFLPFNLGNNYKVAIKPIRIVHFHPYKTEVRIGQKNRENLFQWYCGQNKLKTKLLPRRVEKIFNKHGIKR